MKQTGVLITALILVLLASTVHVDGQSDVWENWQGRMLTEIVELRADLIDYLMEWQQNKITSLTHELETVRREENKIAEEDRQRSQQIGQVELELASPELEAQARPQIEALHAQLIGDAAEGLQAEYAALMRRDIEIARQLRRETERGQMLSQKAQKVRADLIRH